MTKINRLNFENMDDYIFNLVQGKCLMILCKLEVAISLKFDFNVPLLYQNISPSRLPFPDTSFDTIAVNVPSDYPLDIENDMLAEVSRIAKKRILFMADFVPTDVDDCFRTNAAFQLVEKNILIGPDNELQVMILSVFDF